MQSILTRGARRLLVAAGVISLVLSVAAPASWAAKPVGTPGNSNGAGHADDGGETGTDRVLLCHDGHVIEVDDDGHLGGHSNHEDDFVIPAGSALESGDVCVAADEAAGATPVLVCRDGIVVELDDAESMTEGDALVTDPDATVDADCASGTTPVLVCHQGRVIQVDGDSVLADPEQGAELVVDPEATVGSECGGEVVDPIVPVTPPAGDTVAIIPPTEDTTVIPPADDTAVIPPADDNVVIPPANDAVVAPPVVPATPAQPLPAVAPKPIVIISDDAVTAPVRATPASPALENEVLGAITTRTPTAGVGALDPGAHTVAGATTLAATGLDSTGVLVVLGSVLLLGGLALELAGRKRATLPV